MDSKSIIKFKEDLVTALPFFPNNKETKNDLLSQPISSVMFYYIHWASRLVPIKPRKISISPYLTRDHRWSSLKDKIEKLLEKVRTGEDLNPYLSLKAHQKGYTPSDRVSNGDAGRWDDKEFVLNIMGFHHFHLDERIQDSGLSGRTDEVLFARLSRDKFQAVGIFDHSVFDADKTEKNEMNPERTRLWKIFDELSTAGMPPGSVYVPAMITTSGHPMHIHSIVQNYIHVIRQIDPKISDLEYINGIYKETKIENPNNNKLKWFINGLDLGLIDKRNNFFILRYGPT